MHPPAGFELAIPALGAKRGELGSDLRDAYPGICSLPPAAQFPRESLPVLARLWHDPILSMRNIGRAVAEVRGGGASWPQGRICSAADLREVRTGGFQGV